MLIWNDNIKLPEELKTGIFNRIQETYFNKKRFYTSHTVAGDKFAHLLVPFYSKIIEGMMKDLGLYKNTTYGFNLWVQMYNSETTTHEPHSHYAVGDTTIISFTHIINPSKNKCFYFLDDHGDKMYPDHQESGDIFAWPSWLIHGVDHVQEPNLNRLIVAGNVALETYSHP
tara:strand:+ start:119 stop:631 length:513 start_codon:yes stop_codon:yes gene_type:complete